MAIHSDSPASGLPATPAQKIHVAIIMDGNGRWARARGRPRTAGHTIGARTARTIVEHAPSMGIDALTLYAFSSDNWKRPPREVATLMRLFRRYLLSEVDRCVKNGVRLRIVGRRDRLPSELIRAIDGAEAATRKGATLDLRVAVDYSARDTMVRAAQAYAANVATSGPNGSAPIDLSQAMPLTVDGLGQLLSDVNHGGRARDVDLLVRTGGGTADERLPPVGMRLCRALLHAQDVARIHSGRPGGCGRGVPWPGAPLWRRHRSGRGGWIRRQGQTFIK